jgi:hypothetical protein
MKTSSTETFFTTVRAGRYEVISSYEGHVRWVIVKAGSRNHVNFGPIGCAGLWVLRAAVEDSTNDQDASRALRRWMS